MEKGLSTKGLIVNERTGEITFNPKVLKGMSPQGLEAAADKFLARKVPDEEKASLGIAPNTTPDEPELIPHDPATVKNMLLQGEDRVTDMMGWEPGGNVEGEKELDS